MNKGILKHRPLQISHLSCGQNLSFIPLYVNIRLPRTLPRYFRGHSFHFRGGSRTTIHFRSASANPIGASALQVFTSARSSYFKPKIKRIHGVLVAAHFSHILLVIVWVCPRCKYTQCIYIYIIKIYMCIYIHTYYKYIIHSIFTRYLQYSLQVD